MIDYERNSKEFPNLDVDSLKPFQHKKIYYICNKCGYQYLQMVQKHQIGQRCPVCAGKQLVKGINDLEQQYADIQKDWNTIKNGCKPSEVFAHSNKLAYWTCRNGHEYQAIISNRTGVNKSGCPVCSIGHHTQTIEKFIYLVFKSKYKDVNSRVKIKGLEFDVEVKDLKLLIEYNGRFYHRGQPAELRIESRKRKIAEELGYSLLIIREVYSDTQQIQNGEIEFNLKNYNTKTLRNLVSLIEQYIGEQLSLTDSQIQQLIIDAKIERDRLFIVPITEYDFEVQKSWDYEKNNNISPDDVQYLQTNKYYWKCTKCGNSWCTSPYHRTVDNTGCPYCAVIDTGKNPGNIVVTGINDLKTTRPEVFETVDREKTSKNINLDQLQIWQNLKVWWKCRKCGDTFYRAVQRQVVSQGVCNNCTRQSLKIGDNNLRTLFPDLQVEYSMANNGVDARKLYAYTYKIVAWKCIKCGNTWHSGVSERTLRNKQCPHCQNQQSDSN